MKRITALVFFIISFAALAQQDVHIRKPLDVSGKEKIWFDAAMVDSIKGDKFDMWILQMHKPPLKFDNIKQEIYRSVTLYTINLNNVKYGIKEVSYNDVTGKQIFNYNYQIDNVIDKDKYSYPITENSFLYKLIKELFSKSGTSKN